MLFVTKLASSYRILETETMWDQLNVVYFEVVFVQES